MIDSYNEFLKKFNISKSEFFEFGLESTIYPSEDFVESFWNDLKNRINNNGVVTIRSYGRNARNSYIYLDFIKSVWGNSNIRIDSTNNAVPQKIISQGTGMRRRVDALNYQVSHIFGMTRNPFMFECPWNIVMIPKIYDPFTGHESNGEWAAEYQQMFHDLIRKKYSKYIDEYNSIMNDVGIEQHIERYVLENRNIDNIARVENDLKNDFRLL